MNKLASNISVHRSRSRVGVAVLLTVCLPIAGWLGYMRLRRPAPPLPPEPATAGLDADVARAVQLARKRVTEGPLSVANWGYYGKVLLANGMNSEADACFRQAEKLDGENPRWPYYRGLANLESNSAEAIACFQAAMHRGDRFEPDISAPRLRLATLLIQEGRDAEAEEMVNRVSIREPDNPQVLYLRALLLSNHNDLANSLRLFQRLKDHPAARQKVSTKLAQIYQRLGDAESAKNWNHVTRSVSEDDAWPNAYETEVNALKVGEKQRFAEVKRLQEEHRYAEAVELLNRMIENNVPALRRAYRYLGNNLVHLGRGPEAEKAYEQVLRLTPNDAETYNRLALVRLFQGGVCANRFGDHEGAIVHYRRALESAREAVRIDPLLPEAQMTLGQVLVYLDQRQEGIVALRKSLQTRPELSNAHLVLGEALAEEGLIAEARQHLQAALRFANANDRRPNEALHRFTAKYGNDVSPGSAPAALP